MFLQPYHLVAEEDIWLKVSYMKTIPKLSRTSFKYIITPLSMEMPNLKHYARCFSSLNSNPHSNCLNEVLLFYRSSKLICPRPESYKYNPDLSAFKAEAQMENVSSYMSFIYIYIQPRLLQTHGIYQSFAFLWQLVFHWLKHIRNKCSLLPFSVQSKYQGSSKEGNINN